MSTNQQVNQVAVDRREETVVTQQPGYAATEQVTRDVAAERRLVFYQITRVVWAILALVEILLGLRFVLKLIAANARVVLAPLSTASRGCSLRRSRGWSRRPRRVATSWK